MTEIAPLEGFYPAEDRRKDFPARHPDHRYIVYRDLPKLEHLRREYPGLIGE